MRDILTPNSKTYIGLWSKRALLTTISALHAIYIIVYIGAVYVNPNYLRMVNILVQTAVCVYLLVSFNPFFQSSLVKLEKYDANIIFMCAWILATNLVIVEITNTPTVRKWIDTLHSGVKKVVPKKQFGLSTPTFSPVPTGMISKK